MAEKTLISWADSTLNIWAGCTKVSNGPKGACEHCYAENLMDHRLGRALWGPHAKRVEMKGWRAQLRKISRLALAAKRPWFVFVNSLSDFWDKQADPALRMSALDAFRAHPEITFLLLTKRPQMIMKLFREAYPAANDNELAALWPRNVAIGCTVVTQEEADRDIPWLLKAKALLRVAFAFLSMEPLMEAVDLTRVCLQARKPGSIRAGIHLDALHGRYRESGVPYHGDWDISGPAPSGPGVAIDWVITGGETDQGKHKARPSHPKWFRSLRDQCGAASVPFHFKQWGEWREAQLGDEFDTSMGGAGKPPAFIVNPDDGTVHCFLPENPNPDLRVMVRVGKKAAGRELDGVIHDARPQVAA